MSRASRNKGIRGEREFIKALKAKLGDDLAIKRNLEQWSSGGYDIIGLDDFAFEVKRCETLEISKWWKQTVAQAGNKNPVLAFRQSRKPWRIMTEATLPLPRWDIEEQLTVRVEISFADLCKWIKETINDKNSD